MHKTSILLLRIWRTAGTEVSHVSILFSRRIVTCRLNQVLCCHPQLMRSLVSLMIAAGVCAWTGSNTSCLNSESTLLSVLCPFDQS